MSRSFAFVDDPLFLEHQAPGPHPERPERLLAARNALAIATLPQEPVSLRARDATDEQLARVHSERYIDQLGRSAGASGSWDEDTYFSPASAAAARRAAGAATVLVDELLAGRSQFGAALVRPPGHHARPGGAMGFCLLNNVAVAAAHARALGVPRVMIVDVDVHHGNGTQEMFYEDPSVLYTSLHQFPFYPGSGASDELGSGEGLGYTLNVPLSAGAGDGEYAAAFERIVIPVAEQYAPGLLLISAGFDAHELDPLAEMCVTAEGYGIMMEKLVAAVGDVPIGLVLEGGYNLAGLSSSLKCSLEALYQPVNATVPLPSSLYERDLTRAAAAASPHWKLA